MAPYKFENSFFIPVKNPIGILIVIVLNLYVALGNMAVSTVLILPINEHGIFFHFSVSYLISFNYVIVFNIQFLHLLY